MTTGFAVMRLQPFHNGHKKIIDKMLQNHKKAIIVIGSIGIKDNKNPFSFEDRKKMIQLVYPNETSTGQLLIIGAKDIHNPPKWATYIQSLLPCKANCYYCGTGQDAQLFEAIGLKVNQTNREELNISGTSVRRKLKQNDFWQNDIPQQLHKFIQLKQGGIK